MDRKIDIETVIVPLLAALIGPAVALIQNDAYLLTTYERALIFAVAATSLNLILGFGGMVSFGHAVYLGIGAYTAGIMANAGIVSLWPQLVAVVLVCGICAALMGAIALRTSGVSFIMITLALAQIFYYIAVSSSRFGGDDGMVINDRSTLFAAYDPWSTWQFYGFIAGASVLLIWGVAAISASDFGQRLVAIRENAKRAGALGLHVTGTRLVAFVIAGIVCGLAGLLLANQSEFATPGYANWQRSGELLAIVILGGVGLRMGPVYGAFAFIVLEHALAGVTSHWPLLLGPILIAVVLVLRGGLGGLVHSGITRISRLRADRLGERSPT